VTAASMVAGSAPRQPIQEGLARIAFCHSLKSSARPMRQPAHDDFVFADNLLAINAQILSLFVRAFGNNQGPGN